MKYPSVLATIALAILTAGLAGAKPKSPPPVDGGGPLFEKMLEKLDPKQRERMKAAHEKALQDPEIREARERVAAAANDLREKMRAAMLKADPGLEEVMKKQAPNARPGREEAPAAKGFSGLDEGERSKLMAARQAAKSDPKVQAAKTDLEAARTPEERKTAGEAYRKAVSDAVRERDPSLGPVIDRLGPEER